MGCLEDGLHVVWDPGGRYVNTGQMNQNGEEALGSILLQ